MLPRLPPLPDRRSPREARADRALDVVLAAGLVASVALGLADSAERAERRSTGAGDPAPPWAPLAVDVARDPPWVLRLLPGIGPVRARAILEDRRLRGPVASVRDLQRIRGFGKRTVDSLLEAGATATPAAGPAATVSAAAPEAFARAREPHPP